MTQSNWGNASTFKISEDPSVSWRLRETLFRCSVGIASPGILSALQSREEIKACLIIYDPGYEFNMTVHSSNPLGSENASFEFGVCFCVVRKRVRYWASKLADAKANETNFIGALAVLKAMCDLAPASAKPHLAKKEIATWREAFENWFTKHAKKIAKRKVDPEEFKTNVLNQFESLTNAGTNLPEVIWAADVKKDLASIEAS